MESLLKISTDIQHIEVEARSLGRDAVNNADTPAKQNQSTARLHSRWHAESVIAAFR
jgi:hypothetical protein